MALPRFLPLLFALAALPASAKQTIEFWTMSLKPRFTAHMEGLVRSYEAQHPGVKIEWVDFPWDVIQTKLVARIVAGKPPALVNLNVPWAEEYARDGLLQPVDALLGAQRAQYQPGALADLTFSGKVYGFPLYSNVAVIACNRRLFRVAGIACTPRDFDEQLRFAERIVKATGRAGMAPALSKIDGLFLQQDLAVLANGRAVFDSPAHVAFVAKLAAAYKSGALLKDGLFAEDNFPAVIDAYNSGRLGMLLAPPTALSRVRADAPAIYADSDVAPAPLGPTKIADGGWLIHFAVPRGVAPALLPAVGEFALYLTNDANQLALARQANVFPTTVAAANDPYFQSGAQDADASRRAMAAGAVSMPYSRTMYVAGVEDYDELRRILVRAVEAGVTGRQDIQAALSEAAAAWNRKLARGQR